MEDLDKYTDSYEDSFPYSKDNYGVLLAYSEKVIDACNKFQKKIDICSLGIGYESVSYSIYENLKDKIQSYVVIEGSQVIIDRYKSNKKKFPSNFKIVHSYFEHFESEPCFDLIEMGFVLEHVDDPEAIIKRFVKFLKPGGVICAAVPNALSMHRVLGFRANLLEDPYKLNEWDIKLGHKRYFDRDTFRSIFEKFGLIVTKEEGLMLKPFATSQISSLNLSETVWNVLVHSGDLSPRYAYCLYVEICIPEK